MKNFQKEKFTNLFDNKNGFTFIEASDKLATKGSADPNISMFRPVEGETFEFLDDKDLKFIAYHTTVGDKTVDVRILPVLKNGKPSGLLLSDLLRSAWSKEGQTPLHGVSKLLREEKAYSLVAVAKILAGRKATCTGLTPDEHVCFEGAKPRQVPVLEFVE